jgi:beta-glucosidase
MKKLLMKNTFKYSLIYSSVLTLTASLSGCGSSQKDVSTLESQNQREARFASVETDVEAMLAKMTLPEKVSLAHASGKFHINAIERVGIPEMWLSDGPHGVRHQIERDSWNSAGWTNDHATYLPHLTSVAASWDKDIAALHGQVLGAEARERKKRFYFRSRR